jgi:hypothetical protein
MLLVGETMAALAQSSFSSSRATSFTTTVTLDFQREQTAVTER